MARRYTKKQLACSHEQAMCAEGDQFAWCPDCGRDDIPVKPVRTRMSDNPELVARRNALLDLRDARINEIMAGSFPATGEVLYISPERVQALLAQAYTAGRIDAECGLPAGVTAEPVTPDYDYDFENDYWVSRPDRSSAPTVTEPTDTENDR